MKWLDSIEFQNLNEQIHQSIFESWINKLPSLEKIVSAGDENLIFQHLEEIF